jgi:arylsulfatase A-like enzyme
MVFVWIAGFFILCQPVVLAMTAQRPNILFILTDDQSYDAVHALGGNEIQTPHIDRLAREGMTFTHAYNMGAWHGAVCVASRTMLNTGRFLWRAKAREKRLEQDAQQGLFWSQRMRQAGYQTYFTGKWHVQVDVHDLFDQGRVHHVRRGMPSQTEMGYNRPLESVPDRWKPWDKDRGGYWQGGRHWSEVVADDAVEYLQQASDDTPPFFMYIAFNAPHDPRQSPQEFVQRYPQAQIQIPNSFLPEYPYASAMGCGPNLRDERLAPFPRTPHAIQVHRQEYYAIVTHLDEQIGRLLEALRQSGQAENTYVLFTSDHGLAVGRHGLLGKQSMFDHSVRMPLIISGPDVPAGRSLSVPVYMQDVMPTTLELAGVQPSPEIEFHSLLPQIRASLSAGSPATDNSEATPGDPVNPTRSPYSAIYGAYRNLQRMITTDNYKLILYPSIQKTLLFNLREDPEEINDLAELPTHQTTVRRLFSKLSQLQKTMDDPLELGEIYPELMVK